MAANVAGFLHLVVAIDEANRGAHRHRRNCELLARRVGLLKDFFKGFGQDANSANAAAERFMAPLQEALQKALKLLRKCGTQSHLALMWRNADIQHEFQDVTVELDRCLQNFATILPVNMSKQLQTIHQELRSAQFLRTGYSLDEEDKQLLVAMNKELHNRLGAFEEMVGAYQERADANQELVRKQMEAVLDIAMAAHKGEGKNVHEILSLEKAALEEELATARADKDAQAGLIEQFVHILEKKSLEEDAAQQRAGSMPDLDDREPPNEFLCPIEMDLMVDPVMLVQTGVSYERKAIEAWLKTGKRCPKTGVEIDNMAISPNIALRNLIQDWLSGSESFARAPMPSTWKPAKPSTSQTFANLVSQVMAANRKAEPPGTLEPDHGKPSAPAWPHDMDNPGTSDSQRYDELVGNEVGHDQPETSGNQNSRGASMSSRSGLLKAEGVIELEKACEVEAAKDVSVALGTCLGDPSKVQAFVAGGRLHELKEILQGVNKESRLLAAGVLLQLAGSRRNCEAIFEAGLLFSVVTMLRDYKGPVPAALVLALAKESLDASPAFSSALVDNETISTLIEVLNESQQKDVLELALEALVALCWSSAAQEEMIDQGALNTAVDLLPSFPVLCASLLYRLLDTDDSRANAANTKYVSKEAPLRPLVELLVESCPLETRITAALLLRKLIQTDNKREAMLKEGALPCLVSLLREGVEGFIAAAELLACLLSRPTVTSSVHSRTALALGAVPLLSQQATSTISPLPVRRAAGAALHSLALNGVDVGSDIVQFACTMLDSSPGLALNLLVALTSTPDRGVAARNLEAVRNPATTDMIINCFVELKDLTEEGLTAVDLLQRAAEGPHSRLIMQMANREGAAVTASYLIKVAEPPASLLKLLVMLTAVSQDMARSLANSADMVAAILRAIQSSSWEVATEASRLLQEVVTGAKNQVQQNTTLIPALVRMLGDRPFRHTCEAAAKALDVLLGPDPELALCKQALTEGALARLTAMVGSSTDEVCSLAALILLKLIPGLKDLPQTELEPLLQASRMRPAMAVVLRGLGFDPKEFGDSVPVLMRDESCEAPSTPEQPEETPGQPEEAKMQTPKTRRFWQRKPKQPKTPAPA